MSGEVEVLHPGLYSTIQDVGRWGFMEYGVPRSGPMDTYASRMANLLLNNSKHAAVLEITQLGPKLRFSEATNVVISGGDLSPMLNGDRIENNHIIAVRKGDILHFGNRITGCRAYLAIRGGFQTEEVLQSRSWYEGITAFFRLQKGMVLAYSANSEEKVPHPYATIRSRGHLSTLSIEALPGPEYDQMSVADRKKLLNRKFSLAQNSDRMGFQLSELFPNNLESILTAPVMPGTVQLAPSGKIIVLMRDSQTTGGYPRILQLTERGINSIAQKIPGEQWQFIVKNEVLS